MEKKTLSRRDFLKSTGAGFAGTAMLGVWGQGYASSAGSNWPTRPIHVSVGWAAGGSSDYTTRVVAKALEDALDTTIQVTDNPGAHGAVAGTQVAQREANGYNMFAGAAVLGTWPVMGQSKFSWEDFFPMLSGIGPTAIFVKDDSKYKTIDDMIKAIKSNPGQLKIGTTGKGDNGEIFGGKLLEAAGLKADDLNFIPYSGGRDAIRFLRAGTIDFAATVATDASDIAASGKIRPIANLLDKDATLDGVKYPSAVKKYPKLSPYTAINPYFGFYLSRKTPDVIVKRFGKAFLSVMKQDSLRQKLEKRGIVVDPLVGIEADKMMEKITAARSWAEESLGITAKSPAKFGTPHIENFSWPPNQRIKKLEQNMAWPKELQ